VGAESNGRARPQLVFVGRHQHAIPAQEMILEAFFEGGLIVESKSGSNSKSSCRGIPKSLKS
jgi:hypothetical protein